MNKRLMFLLLGLLLISFATNLIASAENYDKLAIEEAIRVLENGEELTPVQKAIIEAEGIDNRELDQAGGPDEFGYIYTDGDEPNGPAFQWLDVSQTGIAIDDIPGDDDASGPFDIGFEFPFYGAMYTQWYLGSNGIIGFSEENMRDLSNDNLPSANTPDNIIAWFWDDMDPDGGVGGQCFVQNFTDEVMGDYFVIQFVDWLEYNNNAELAVNAQIILFASGDILLQYNEFDEGFDRNSATVGIENSDGTIGLTYVFNDELIAPEAGTIIHFERIPTDASVNGMVFDQETGDPIPGANIQFGFNVTVSDDQGFYEIPEIFSGEAVVLAEAQGYYNYEDIYIVEPGDNNYDIAMEAIPPPPPPLTETSFDDFEDGPGLLVAGMDNSVWEYGQPTLEPENANSPVFAWGSPIDADYGQNEDDTLFTINSWELNVDAAFVSYWHWYDFETGYDGYNFQVSTDGGMSWEILNPVEMDYPDDDINSMDEPGFTGHDGMAWTEVTYDLAPYLGQIVQFAFRFGSDGSVYYPGVTIDDFLVNLGAPGPDPMTLPLAPMYFELVSSYLAPEDPNAISVFSDILDLAIVYDVHGGIFLPPDLNTIGDITPIAGYRIFCYEASSWTVAGDYVDPASPVVINAGPWNWIGYPYDVQLPLEMVFAGITDHVVIMMADDGRLWIPELQINSILTLTPGEGYMIIVSEDLEFNYALHGAMLRTDRTDPVVERPVLADAPKATGLPYAVVVSLTDELKAQNPAFIEIYDSNLMVGKSIVDENSDYTPVIAWEGSAEHNLEGFVKGHQMTIKVLSADGSEISTSTNAPVFGEGAYAEYCCETIDSFIPSEFSVNAAYPNPFNPSLTLEFAIPSAGEVKIAVYNLLGQSVFEKTNSYQAGSQQFIFDASSQGIDLVSGMYFINVEHAGTNHIQKVMLLK